MVFCGWLPEIHSAYSGCTSGSSTQHQGGECSTWQGMGPLSHVKDKKQVLNQPTETQASYIIWTGDYLFQTKRWTECSARIDRYRWTRDHRKILIKTHYFDSINSWFVSAVMLFGKKGIVLIHDIINYYSIIFEITPRFKSRIYQT